MPVEVRIPAYLRDATSGAERVAGTGTTVAALIADLGSRHPALPARMLDDSGLRRLVNVYVGAQDVRYAAGLATPVGDGDLVTILPSWATAAG